MEGGKNTLSKKPKDGDNREFAVEYLRSTKKVLTNILFEKPNKGKTTYKEMSIPAKDAPLHARKIRRIGPMLHQSKMEKCNHKCGSGKQGIL